MRYLEMRIRVPLVALLFLAVIVVPGSRSFADEPTTPTPVAEKAPPPSMPAVATEEATVEALAAFKKAYRAHGLKGEDRLSQREFAMRTLAEVQHPEVVKALAKVSRNRDELLRTLAVIYLGDQTAVAGPAGTQIVKAMKRHKKDQVLVLSGLESIGRLRYLGARDELYAYLANGDFAVKKATIETMGETRDWRMMGDLLKLVGIHWRAKQLGGVDSPRTDDRSGDPEVIPGYSWEGVDVFIPYSGSGDELAERERIGREMIEANRRAAEQAHARQTASSSGGAPTARGAASRDGTDLIPPAVEALRRMTGEPFLNQAEIVAWLKAKQQTILKRLRKLDVEERRQRKGPGRR